MTLTLNTVNQSTAIMSSPKVFNHASFSPLSKDAVVQRSAYEHLSDEEIVSQILLKERPVASEKNIWAYWHTGWNTLVGWRQRITIDWIRRLGPDWQVRVLDGVEGSPWHFTRWTAADGYPKCMLDGSLAYEHVGQHISDAVRLLAVIEHGGIYYDMGLMLLGDVTNTIWEDICDAANPTEMVIGMWASHKPNLIMQGIMAARPNNPFLKGWMTIYHQLWQGRLDTRGMSRDPLLAEFPMMAITDDTKKMGGGEMTAGDLNDYLSHALAGNRLMQSEDPDPTKFHGARYFREHVRYVSFEEFFPWHVLSIGEEYGCLEEELFARLSAPFEPDDENDNDDDGDRRDDRRRRIRGMMERYFGPRGVVHKLSNGMLRLPTLAKLWTANPQAEVEPGTWAEYVRWGRIHLVQRERYTLNKPAPGKVWKVGLLEPATPETETYEPENSSEELDRPIQPILEKAPEA